MTPLAAGFLRLSAVVLALLFGFVAPLFIFIDVYPTPRKTIVVAVFAVALLLGATLQLGLFYAPSAVERGPRAIVMSAALMLPIAILCAWQLADFVHEILHEGLAVLSKYPPSDLRLLAMLVAIEVVYGWAFVVLWRAYRTWGVSAA